MKREIDIEFIAPLFSLGATDTPEIRPPSIRGQLHEWFRILGGDIVAERRVFGGIRQTKASFQGHDDTLASKIVVRVDGISGNKSAQDTLPHKHGGEASPRNAFLPGTRCRLLIMDRRGGLQLDDERLLQAAVDAWLLMGTLGYRSTRAGGSFTWQDGSFPPPADPNAYQAACRTLLADFNAHAKTAVLPEEYRDAESARRIISDSLGGRNDPRGKNDLKRLHDPLGKVFNGRKTSPLKYRIVQFGTTFRILAFWDGRSFVTGNSDEDFRGLVQLLKTQKPAIGEPLHRAFFG